MDKLIMINRDILLKGIFAYKYLDEKEDSSEILTEMNEIEELKKSKEMIESKLQKTDVQQEYLKKIKEFDSILQLNKPEILDEMSISEKIEQYQTYMSIYNDKLKYITDHKGLIINSKTYESKVYYYLVSKNILL